MESLEISPGWDKTSDQEEKFINKRNGLREKLE